MSVSTIVPPQTVDCMKEKIKDIYRYRRPNRINKIHDRLESIKKYI